MDRKQKEKDQAFNLYFQTELSNKQICELINIDRKTLYMWVKEGDWRHTKYAAKHAPGMLVNQYYDQLGHMNNFIAQRAERPYPTKEEADVMRKVSLTLKSIKGKGITHGETIFILTDLMCNIRLRDKKVAETLTTEVDNYVKSLVKEGKGLDGPWKEYLNGINEDREYEEWASTRSQPIMPDNAPNPDDDKEEDVSTPSTDLADNNTETQIDTDVNTSPAIAFLDSHSNATDVAKEGSPAEAFPDSNSNATDVAKEGLPAGASAKEGLPAGAFSDSNSNATDVAKPALSLPKPALSSPKPALSSPKEAEEGHAPACTESAEACPELAEACPEPAEGKEETQNESCVTPPSPSMLKNKGW